MPFLSPLLLLIAVTVPAVAQSPSYGFAQSQAFLKQYCEKCHDNKAAAGGFRLERVGTPVTLGTEAAKWTVVAARITNGEMPPKGSPVPAIEEREAFTQWVGASLKREACAAGVVPGPSPIRRLNRDEYAATISDLFDIHLDLAQLLPADGAGGEGFDNAAETLFLSPLLSEKYLDAAKFVADYAAKEFKPRNKILIAQPGKGVTAEQAARTILGNFLPLAFRRPISDADLLPYLALFHAARKQGQNFEGAVFFAIRSALVSPLFLFRSEPPNPYAEPRLVDQYSMASRLSYFLWGSMPDELLFDVAAAGKLHDRDVIRELIGRMLRNDRSLEFAKRFTEQWLRTRELGSEKIPDAKLFPEYATDEELRGDIRFQPILFFRELLIKNRSLLDLIDSKGTIATSNLEKHFAEKLPLRANQRKQPQRVELPEGSRRGGLLGMPAVLAVSSYPYRTSPVLRGAWVLDSLLGTPPPAPPPNVPPLDEKHNPSAPKTVRERLTQHRENAVCASCHNRIDPLGFALENFDAIGRWRDHEEGKPVDNSGELMDGTRFQGPQELKKALLDRKDLFLRNLTGKVLGYALGRGLTLKDSCTVDQIVVKVKESNYSAQTLIEEIVWSVPFRYQAARLPQPPKPKEPSKP